MITAFKILLAVFGGIYAILGLAMLIRRETCARHLQTILQEHFRYYIPDKPLRFVVAVSAIIVALTSATLAMAAILW